MLTLDASDPVDTGTAVRALADGLVVAVPTDTVYGLAVDPWQAEAIDRLFALKERPSEVPLPVLVAGWDQVEAVAGSLGEAARRLADQHWPGPLTLVVWRNRRFTADLGGSAASTGTVGVRWPDHAGVQALCRTMGPLAVTSANRHGRPAATTAGQVAATFAGDARLAAVVDGGVCDGVPSTVVECVGPAPRCLRDGALPWSELDRG